MTEINEEEMSEVTDQEEEICCVCLGTINEKALLDMCLHFFCFECIKMWSTKKAVCPLCTVPFKTIMYNIKSDYEYLEYRVDDSSRTNTSHQQNRLDVQRENQALQRARENQALQRTREIVRRLEESQTASRLLTRSRWSSDTNIAGTSSRRNRSQIYKMNLWAKDLKRVDGIPVRVRDVRPSFLTQNEACCHRLHRWLNREVLAVLGSRVNASEVVSNVIKYCKKFYILGDQFHDKMSRMFGAKTRHFVHEFYHFASSPHEMEEYDKNVIYGPPDENCVNVVLVSESEEEVAVLPSSSQNTPIELSGDEDDDDDCEDVTGALAHKTPQISLISPKESRQTERESTCSYRPSTDQTSTRDIAKHEIMVRQKRMSNDEDDDDDDDRIHTKKLRSVVGLNLLSQKLSKSQSRADEKHGSFKKHHSGHKNRSRRVS